METIKIVALCVSSAIVYGILHDQVTARVCVEYFTIGHPPIFGTESPTLLAIGWGIVATWWVGLILSVPLAVAARGGNWPLLKAKDLVRPIGVLLLIVAGVALMAGIGGYVAGRNGLELLDGRLRERITEGTRPYFVADLMAHLGSYAGGFVGGIALCGWVLARRRRLARDESAQRDELGRFERGLLAGGMGMVGLWCLSESVGILLIFLRLPGQGVLEVLLAVMGDVCLFVAWRLWGIRKGWMVFVMALLVLLTLLAMWDALLFP